jgi:hypothetical protein
MVHSRYLMKHPIFHFGLLLGFSLLMSLSCANGHTEESCSGVTCHSGCCNGEECIESTVQQCGINGTQCMDCTIENTTDICIEGQCVCQATGASCESNTVCTADGCITNCNPDCSNKCPDADDGCGGSCTDVDCASGCCDSQSNCINTDVQPDIFCGNSGEECFDCTLDPRSDTCSNGVCICAATGSLCDSDLFCTVIGCSLCTPDCVDGCCDESGNCMAFASQSDLQCGNSGEVCQNCSVYGSSCDSGIHACLSSLTNDAMFVRQSIPRFMTPGETVEVTVTMRNIGSNNWTKGNQHLLGAHNPQDNYLWGFNRVYLEETDTILPGETKTFVFQVTAPLTRGIHNFQWRMLQEGVTWFGTFSNYVPIMIDNPSTTIKVCETVRSLAGTTTDAAPIIQECIDTTPSGGILELPPGIYQLNSKITINSNPITLRTENMDLTQPQCTLSNHNCAELLASNTFQDEGGILEVSQAGSIIDHLVFNGNKTVRANTPSATQCASGNNSYGHNLRMMCSDCSVTNCVTKNALCGTGCEFTNTEARALFWRNIIANNGVHNQEGMWADGVTVHDHTNSTFTQNLFIDNTDVDFIFGGCEGCIIQQNSLWHTTAFSGSSFAVLMLHAWTTTSGNFNGCDTSLNTIDCSSDWSCGFGLYLGSDAWYTTEVFGGDVHHNQINNASQGLLIDDSHDMDVYTNPVSNPATSVNTSCGSRPTTDYSMGTNSYNINTSRDRLGTTYSTTDWDGCIPNWWQ